MLPLRVPNHAPPLLTELLQAVSRSFYLTLRALPARVRPQIGLAYLLARTTDTIADTELLPVPQRLRALGDLRAAIQGERPAPSFAEVAAAQPTQPGGGTNAERVLLERVGEMITLLTKFDPADQQRIREVLATITSGQELDLQRFGRADATNITALATEAEIDDYTYRVAGCVGEFWTKMCRAHVFPQAPLDDATLLRDGVRFGQGLQWVNILRDLPRDLRQGRCYLPSDRLAQAQLTPHNLRDPQSIEKLRPVYDQWLAVAEAHLAAGWNYTNALPRSAIRVRLACAWPILIGVKTLAKLRRENPLDATHRVKVSRREVRSILFATLLKYPFPRAWEKLFARAQGEGR
ncbi:MAG TPA: phytoene/squalene synthase family protein [Opitutaceae bacterium]|nr:phytoene/squalene synthase family protein [Opitutaceae bacterium]